MSTQIPDPTDLPFEAIRPYKDLANDVELVVGDQGKIVRQDVYGNILISIIRHGKSMFVPKSYLRIGTRKYGDWQIETDTPKINLRSLPNNVGMPKDSKVSAVGINMDSAQADDTEAIFWYKSTIPGKADVYQRSTPTSLSTDMDLAAVFGPNTSLPVGKVANIEPGTKCRVICTIIKPGQKAYGPWARYSTNPEYDDGSLANRLQIAIQYYNKDGRLQHKVLQRSEEIRSKDTPPSTYRTAIGIIRALQREKVDPTLSWWLPIPTQEIKEVRADFLSQTVHVETMKDVKIIRAPSAIPKFVRMKVLTGLGAGLATAEDVGGINLARSRCDYCQLKDESCLPSDEHPNNCVHCANHRLDCTFTPGGCSDELRAALIGPPAVDDALVYDIDGQVDSVPVPNAQVSLLGDRGVAGR